jgi:hypothetical protein
VPVVGFLHPGSPEPSASLLAAFRQGLAEAGYRESENVAIEFRSKRTALTVGAVRSVLHVRLAWLSVFCQACSDPLLGFSFCVIDQAKCDNVTGYHFE